MVARHRRRLYGIAILAGATLLSLVAVQAATARVAHDPCGSNRESHVASHGLHCGAIFEIPGHRTWLLPIDAAPPDCPKGESIPFNGSHHTAHTLAWDYWTYHGEWVLWNGFYKIEHNGPVTDGANHVPGRFGPKIYPFLHNFGLHPWAVRVYWECK